MADGGEVLFRFIGDSAGLDNTIAGVQKSLDSLSSDTLNAVGRGFQTLGGIISSTTAAVVGFGTTYNAEIESITMSLETLTGSSELAANIMEQIKKDAAKTPFDVKSLAKGEQMLLATGLSADESRESILALGNAISAVGGDSSTMVRMISNLQQIQNAGRATSMDIRQFAYAGIDIYGLLADSLGKTTEEISEMQSRGEIGYKEISDALKNAANEGGRFYGAMEKQSETFNGMISNFQDNFGNFTGTIASSFSEALKKALKPLNDLIDRLNDVVKNNKKFKQFGDTLSDVFGRIGDIFNKLSNEQLDVVVDFGLALAKASPLLIGIGTILPKLAGLFGGLSSSISGATGVIGALLQLIPGWGTAIGIVIGAIGGLSSAVIDFIGIFTGITAIVGVLGYINNETNNKLYEMSVTFRQKAPEMVKGFIDYFNASFPMIIEQGQNIIRNIVTGIDMMVPSLLSGVKTILLAIADTMKTNGRQIARVFTDIVLGLIKVLIECAPDFLEGMYEIMDGILQSIIDNAPDIIQAMATCIKRSLEVMNEKEPEFMQLGIELLDALLNGLIEAMPTIIEILPSFIERMVYVYTSNITLFVEVGALIIGGLIRGMIAAIPELIKNSDKVADAIIRGLKSAFGIHSPSTVTANIGGQIMQGLINGIGDKIGNIGNKVREVGDRIKNTLGGISLWDTGSNLLSGLWNGISSASGWVMERIRGMANTVLNTIKNTFGVHSPSTEFAYVGEMNMRGLSMGMENGQAEVQSLIDGMFNLQPNVEPMMEVNQENPLKELFAGLMDSVNRPVELDIRADEGIIVSKVVNGLKEFQRANGRLPF